jgi:hypothetical protein
MKKIHQAEIFFRYRFFSVFRFVEKYDEFKTCWKLNENIDKFSHGLNTTTRCINSHGIKQLSVLIVAFVLADKNVQLVD